MQNPVRFVDTNKHETKIISFWMQRGGVGKTTHSTEFASTLASLGYKVLMVDADPQCDTTKRFLEPLIEEKGGYAKFLEYKPPEWQNITGASTSICEVMENIKNNGLIEQIPVSHKALTFQNGGGVWVVPGNPKISKFEIDMSVAHAGIPNNPRLSTICVAPHILISRASKNLKEQNTTISADFVILDLNPHPGILNSCFFMSSHYAIMPLFIDSTTVLNIDVATETIILWYSYAQDIYIKYTKGQNLRKEDKFPDNKPKILGYITARYDVVKRGYFDNNGIIMGDIVAKNVHSYWEQSVEQMKLAFEKFKKQELVMDDTETELAHIRSFNQIGSMASILGVPICCLDAGDMIKYQVNGDLSLMEKRPAANNWQRVKELKQIYYNMVSYCVDKMISNGDNIIKYVDKADLIPPVHLVRMRLRYGKTNRKIQTTAAIGFLNKNIVEFSESEESEEPLPTVTRKRSTRNVYKPVGKRLRRKTRKDEVSEEY